MIWPWLLVQLSAGAAGPAATADYIVLLPADDCTVQMPADDVVVQLPTDAPRVVV